METFYDTHAHLTFPDFAKDIPGLLERAASAGITRIITIGTDLESSQRTVALAEAHAAVYAVVGWHPNDLAPEPDDVRPALRELCSHPKVVAIGETGIDHFRLPSGNGGSEADDFIWKDRQVKIFSQQLNILGLRNLFVNHEKRSVGGLVQNQASQKWEAGNRSS